MKKERIIFIISLVIMLLATSVSVYATSCLYNSSDVSYSPPSGSGLSANVQDSLTEVYGHCTDYTNLEQRVSTIENNFLDKTYPVGSIYISTTDSTVSAVQSKFGGTWVAFGTGRTLVGIDTSQSVFNSVEKTGGEKNHTLLTRELPERVIVQGNNMTGSQQNVWGVDMAQVTVNNATSMFGSQADIAAKGLKVLNESIVDAGGKSHNNLQPYITVYMYKRVS